MKSVSSFSSIDNNLQFKKNWKTPTYPILKFYVIEKHTYFFFFLLYIFTLISGRPPKTRSPNNSIPSTPESTENHNINGMSRPNNVIIAALSGIFSFTYKLVYTFEVIYICSFTNKFKKALFWQDAHDDFCGVCNQSGQLLLCDTCSKVYHLQCLDPPLSEIPDGRWCCPKCQVITEIMCLSSFIPFSECIIFSTIKTLNKSVNIFIGCYFHIYENIRNVKITNGCDISQVINFMRF